MSLNWDILLDCVDYALLACALGVVTFIWRSWISSRITLKASLERMDILSTIKHWECRTGRKKLALKEFSQVTLEQHAKFNRDKNISKTAKRCLYGPIIQTLMRGDASQLGNKQWWRCYKEIYLEMDMWRQEQCRFAFYKAQVHGQTSDFFVALQLMQIDGYKILKQNDERSGKLFMEAGAAEYDEAMAAQELMQ